ncbi:MAG: hypothetical protein IPP33_11840 [Flavobacteriales bacterium]|nr:hypothetical protein [Flavobacteriales bacterium]
MKRFIDPTTHLLGSGHLLLINKRKETSVFTTLLLSLGTFLLVLYSTFLTRSGVLGDTSVHSFTGEGMLPGLLTFMPVFVLVATTMLNNDKQWRLYYLGLGAALLLAGAFMGKMSTAILIYALLTLLMTLVALHFTRSEFKHAEEEDGSSREFWLFIGSLVLLLSAIQITWTTSIPVYNLLMGPFGEWAKRAPPVETIEHYNKWQIPFAFIVALLVAVGQYLRYRTTDRKALRELALPFIGAFCVERCSAFGIWDTNGGKEGTLIALFFATAFAALA